MSFYVYYIYGVIPHWFTIIKQSSEQNLERNYFVHFEVIIKYRTDMRYRRLSMREEKKNKKKIEGPP